MKVHRGIKLKETKNVRFGSEDCLAPKHESLHRLKACVANAMLDLCDLKILDEPFKVDSGMLRARHQTITSHIVETVCIELTGDDCGVYRTYATAAHHICDVIGKTTAHLA